MCLRVLVSSTINISCSHPRVSTSTMASSLTTTILAALMVSAAHSRTFNAALHYRGKFICSSVLVTPTTLITAAHCVVLGREQEDPKKYNAYIGSLNRDGPGTELFFTEIISHPQYGSGTEYDIALMKIDSPVQLNEAAQTICLPTKDSLYEDITGQVIGWPVSEKGGRISAKTLQTASVMVPTIPRCEAYFKTLGIPVTRSHVCVRGKKVCLGDPGSPLVVMNDDQLVLIGLTSFGTDNVCDRQVSAVYTATASYIDWIVENLGDASDLCFVN